MLKLFIDLASSIGGECIVALAESAPPSARLSISTANKTAMAPRSHVGRCHLVKQDWKEALEVIPSSSGLEIADEAEYVNSWGRDPGEE